MYTIRQAGERWEVLGPAGEVLAVLDTYALGLAYIAGQLGELAQLAVAADPEGDEGEDGLLPEAWVSDPAMCFSTETGDGRDFTECTWTSRDPATSLLPLMLQTETEMGHFGAVLAGFMEQVDTSATNPTAGGRFYDSEAGRAARDLLLGGRRFGVSVDPGAVEFDWQCVQEDDDGWCIEDRMVFTAYEVIGLTMTPFPAFAEAAIVLAGEAASAAPARLPALAASAPARPPAAWFAEPEPQVGDERLVRQPNGSWACPLTITDEGQVYGHLAAGYDQCHVGHPGLCVSPPRSAAAYVHFNVGEVVTAEGERVPTGALTVGCDHAPLSMSAAGARDHYANSGLGWADVQASDGELAPWVCGALRPGLGDDDMRVLRALTLSGDWRRQGGALELIGALAVNSPGFPVARQAVAASSLAQPATVRAGARVANGVQQALVASNVVTRCADCERARAAGARPGGGALSPEAMQLLRTLERRTRHLVPDAMAHLAQRVHAPGS